jgi:alpha-glucoside transport system permease protein
VVIGAVSVAAVVPLVILAVVALRGPDGWSVAAFTDVWRDRWLLHSVEATFWVALLATIIVVAAAAPLAYRLAVAPAGWVTRTIVSGLVVLAVLPVQAYLGPLDIFIDDHGLSGTRVPLVLVHAAAGLPIAVLILRGAVAAPPGSPAADALRGLAAPGTISRRLLDSAGPALGAVAVLEFVQVWNDFIVGLLISGAGASPWSLLLWGEARQFGENAAQLAAGSLIAALLPVALVLSTWRRWIVPGLTGGVLR